MGSRRRGTLAEHFFECGDGVQGRQESRPKQFKAQLHPSLAKAFKDVYGQDLQTSKQKKRSHPCNGVSNMANFDCLSYNC